VSPVDRIRPVAPADGDVVGPRAVFEIEYDALADPHPRRLNFRIRLEPVRPGVEAKVFDQREREAGWLVGAPGRVLYRPRRDLDDGSYRWEAAAWSGVEWLVARERPVFRVDSVPPAPVAGLSVELVPGTGVARLEWDPVALDRDGSPEYVARYHVYRFEEGGPFRTVRPREIAVVEQPRYVDDTALEEHVQILYYRVTAEDLAGNEGGR
jgi:hypothetical protein